MGQLGMKYLSATRHPWPCLLFLLPLLLAYEGGLCWLGGTHPETIRNGADTWLRWTLEAFGFSQLYWAPALLGIFFFGWSVLRRMDRPQDSLSVCVGMGMESAVFAGGLLVLSRHFASMMKTFGVVVAYPPTDKPEMLARTVTFLGAGIYEEVLFRLILFSTMVWVMRQIGVPSFLTLAVATLTSALMFSAAHHVGPYGEPYNLRAFLFRVVAGTYFTLLYRLRGFGVAAGTHACYDVLVGVVLTH